MAKRLRSLTPKAMEVFENKTSEYALKLSTSWKSVQYVLDEYEDIPEDISVIEQLLDNVSSCYVNYSSIASEYTNFLTRTNIAQCEDLSRKHELTVACNRDIYDSFHLKLIELKNQLIEHDMQSSHRSRTSRRSTSSVSALSSVIARKQAKTEAAKARMEYAQKEAELKLQQAQLLEEEQNAVAAAARKRRELDVELKLMAERKEVAAAEAELEVLETYSENDRTLSQLGRLDRESTTAQYVKEQNRLKAETAGFEPGPQSEARENPSKAEAPEFVPAPIRSEVRRYQLRADSSEFVPVPVRSEVCEYRMKAEAPEFVPAPVQSEVCENAAGTGNVNAEMTAAGDVAKFLLKKDLLLSRLTNFNDEPAFYHSWKNSFKSVARDLSANSSEEIDLLVKYLGKDSKTHAVRLRAVYISNPVLGLEMIWKRLDERYGAPELIKHSIVSKLNTMPKITGKDPKKFYDMVDILSEVEALKHDPKYSAQLSYFDTSEGILPIVQKLPYNIQEKWVSKAYSYKKNNHGAFPPFSVFVEFVSDVAKLKNDPGLACHSVVEKSVNNARSFHVKSSEGGITCKKTEVGPSSSEVRDKCPIHKANHSLLDCRTFKLKSLSERKSIVKASHTCFKCLQSSLHKSADCKKEVKCSICNSPKHLSLMHEVKQRECFLSGQQKDGGESAAKHSGVSESAAKHSSVSAGVDSRCTQICGTSQATGKSCAKIVLVDVSCKSNPAKRVRTYAIIDDQSNRSLAKPQLFEELGIDGVSTAYTLHSCSGSSLISGRTAVDCMVEGVTNGCSYPLPPILECTNIPNTREEIPTKEIVSQFPHLRGVSAELPTLDENAEILLLIGRDLSAAHHVHDQVLGPGNAPFAQRLGLGWVVVGQVCLGKVHHEDVVCNKTYLLPNGRHSLFQPCPNNLAVVEHYSDGDNLFVRTKDDNKLGLSVEDREFLAMMDTDMKKDSNGQWIAPLPFRSPRPSLPNNRAYAYKRACLLHASLSKDSKKQAHFVTFMQQIIGEGHAEKAPPLDEKDECWYLPLFGVYHPKKPDQIRGVFDASAKFEGISLNDVLLQGPDLMNNLTGVLLRFRRDEVAVCADIQQMFYNFLVDEKDRNFLRFFWYRDNNPQNELIEYRMRVHVFGNKPSPSVANLGLQKTAEMSEAEFGSDVRSYISNDFYVDDGLTSLPTVDRAVDLMKRTQTALRQNGHLRLHKIASNSEQVLKAFPKDDLAKDLTSLDLSEDDLPIQRSLGLSWSLSSDSFTYLVPKPDKPFTRRGVLSVINSLYDPLGFVSPVTITGKVLLKAMTVEDCGWDDLLPNKFLSEWTDWVTSLQSLHQLSIPRTYFDFSLSEASDIDLVLFSDASEKAIASVAFLVSHQSDGLSHFGFVMGKTKVAPSRGHTIPRLELCAAVLSVELADFLLEQLNLKIRQVSYFTDSKVVLGYVCNRTRRFYTYVSNRVERILSSSRPSQWHYVGTKNNPADAGTRGVAAINMSSSIWLHGPQNPAFLNEQEDKEYQLLDPDDDKEVRSEVVTMATHVTNSDKTQLDSHRFEKFSSLTRLVRAISHLQHICVSFTEASNCKGWHLCPDVVSKQQFEKAQNVIIKVYQHEWYEEEMICIDQGRPIPSNSTLTKLNPFLDEEGILRVGGRLKSSTLPSHEKNPVIVPGKSYLALLLIKHFHEKVLHQGRHFTEGAVRSGGFWITGAKRKISSILFNCFQCRKLRGKTQTQLMADLPEDRISQALPFSFVGVDVFGPWSVVTRRTRGGQASSKRWAVLFTCLCIRAVHIELIEEMSSGAFINALRRFVAIRGPVVQFRSDRGTNFVGATEDLNLQTVSVEDGPIHTYLQEQKVTWVFNPPHASHMGGVWERMIGVVRRILDSLLNQHGQRDLTHDVLQTFMAEVMAIVNARPIVPVSSDSEVPEILNPAALLTLKSEPLPPFVENLTIKDIYRSEWKRVQMLADQFWAKWKSEFLNSLQERPKWCTEKPNLKAGDVVLMRDNTVNRNQWPIAIITETFPSKDAKVRTVKVRIVRDGKRVFLTRPVTELVLLSSE